VKYEAVVFDLYGTLVDGPTSLEDARVDMASALGVPEAEFEEAWRLFRRQRDSGELGSVDAAIEAAMGRLGVKASSDSVRAAKATRYRSIREGLEPRPGAVSLLRQIRTKGYKLGLLSNCSCEVPELWSDTRFAGSFDATVFSASEGLLKPDKALYMRACGRLGVLPEKCLYVGDGGSDELDGASAVGMTPWLLLLPHEDPPSEQKHAASAERWRHRHLKSLTEILDVVDGRI
jgi:putative hydrolase of the HAD superfamily